MFVKNELPYCNGHGKIFIDGAWIGNMNIPTMDLKKEMVTRRRQKCLHFGLWIKGRDLHINCDSGRVMRPVLVVENKKLIVTDVDE